MTKYLFGALGIAILAVLAIAPSYIEVITRAYSKELCSCYFVMKRDKSFCQNYAVRLTSLNNISIDQESKQVVVELFGIKESSSYLSDKEGCRLN